jgi:NADH-quinone oxidoreductase subunit H
MIEVAVKTLFIFVVVVVIFAPVITWIERKQSAIMQDRIGANRADVLGMTFLGLLHPLADVIKLLTKEDFVPARANRFLHALAPVVAAVPAMIAFAVIPYGGVYRLGDREVSLVAADIDWGVLYILAVGSLATYGAVLAGWSSRSNWSILGSVRASAQMISYQVTMGLSLVGVFMVFGTLKLTDMAIAQDTSFRVFGFLELFPWLPVGPAWLDALRLPGWGVFLQPLAFLLFLTCIMAENKRPPFDLPEGDSELVAGYLTEYSGMRFGLFYLAEFVQVVVIGGVVTALFLGGWSVPYLPQESIIGAIAPLLGESFATVVCMLLHVATFFTKVAFMIWLQMLIRWSFPRFRYDQLMDLCWKVILPLSLLNIFVTAGGMLIARRIGGGVALP